MVELRTSSCNPSPYKGEGYIVIKTIDINLNVIIIKDKEVLRRLERLNLLYLIKFTLNNLFVNL